jgi:oligoendopeptidase F
MEKYKTSWDLTLLYKSPKDPQIEKDLKKIESICSNIQKKYQKEDFVKTPKGLFSALEDVEKVTSSISECRPLLYIYLSTQLNTTDDNARALLNKYEERIVTASNKLVFFDLAIARIAKKDRNKYFIYPPLKKYHYLLKKIFASAKYMLSEKEEQLISLFSQPSHSMWVDANQKLLTNQMVRYGKKSIPLSEAEEVIKNLPKNERNILYKEILQAYKIASVIAEPEINALVTTKKILDKKRGYKDATTAALNNHELDKKTVDALLSSVEKYNKSIHYFFSIHAKLLKEKKLSYIDRFVKIGNIEKPFSFNSAVEMIKSTLSQVDKWYVGIFEDFLKKGQIDVFPKPNKTSGAYCAGTVGNPVFVLLNFTEDLHSIETIAHEMGHAFHWIYSQEQPDHYRHHTIATAEVASTFFEQVFSDYIEKTLSEREKVIYLHSKIQRDVQTIFRQIAFFNFENELHEYIRSKGYASSKEIQILLSKHMKAYLGPVFDLTEEDGLQYVSWSHLRLNFYTISYAYGLLVSKGLFQYWKKDKGYIKKVEQFMKAGGSQSPKDIFKKAGINTTDPKFFESGLKAIDADITRLEKLAKKLKMI